MQHRINFHDYADDSYSNVDTMKTFQWRCSAKLLDSFIQQYTFTACSAAGTLR